MPDADFRECSLCTGVYANADSVQWCDLIRLNTALFRWYDLWRRPFANSNVYTTLAWCVRWGHTTSHTAWECEIWNVQLWFVDLMSRFGDSCWTAVDETILRPFIAGLTPTCDVRVGIYSRSVCRTFWFVLAPLTRLRVLLDKGGCWISRGITSNHLVFWILVDSNVIEPHSRRE